MGILDNLEAYIDFDQIENAWRGGPKCYYCNNKAKWLITIPDDIDGIVYEYLHCDDHKDIKDHTQEAIDLWVEHRKAVD